MLKRKFTWPQKSKNENFVTFASLKLLSHENLNGNKILKYPHCGLIYDLQQVLKRK